MKKDIDSWEFDAPEDACCAEHPERRAVYTCPKCKRHVCTSCFDSSQFHCHRCSPRDPSMSAISIPFEDPSKSLFHRVVFTLKSAFFPKQTATSFANCQVDGALRFLLTTAVPLSLLSGVIPFTQTLLFGPSMQLQVVGQPTDMDIVSDVGRAMLVQLLFDMVFLFALLFPFVSLANAYGQSKCTTCASGMILYRFWLIPAAMLTSYLAFFFLPTVEIGLAVQFVILLGALFFIVTAMWWTARITCGIGPLWSVAVVGIPWILAMVTIALITIFIASLLGVPTPESLEPS